MGNWHYAHGGSRPINGRQVERARRGRKPTCFVGAGLVPALPVGVADYRAPTRDAPTPEGTPWGARTNATRRGRNRKCLVGAGLALPSGGWRSTMRDGKRVQKSTGGAAIYYWFSPEGKELSESNSGGTLYEYIYFNGARTALRDSGGGVYYYFSDPLGSARTQAKSTGTVCFDADYTPFGYEMDYNTSCAHEYKFADMQGDTETGNYHTWFRNFEYNLGRWMSPDPLAGDVTNPQSLNRYAYVRE